MFYLFSCLFIIAILCCVCVVGFLSHNLTINLLSSIENIWWLNLSFDAITFLILLMLLVCFLYVYLYNNHYFGYSFDGFSLNNLICLFVFVMGILVCTGDYLLSLVFWEYLGVVSFFLILFYDNYLSLRSSVITLVSSRFGDICLFLLICLSLYNVSYVVLVLFFFVIFTKSAGFPFISWLLEAMRAPTPVSSLVHSSTLVAAGVWFFMRYDIVSYFNNMFYICLVILLTIFITGLSSFFFMDLKKIVALSTCNNISWCLFYLIFGDFFLSLFQLISHGVSKCMLFMIVGDVMNGSGGSQASNCVYNAYLYNNWNIFSLFSIVLGLSGIPFIGVFFTKHFLLTEFMNVTNLLLYTFVIICIFISYFYSFRFCSILLNPKSSSVVGVSQFFNSSSMLYFWLFINFFIVFFLNEVNTVSNNLMTMVILFQLVSCFTAYFFYNCTVFSNWSSSLFGCDNIVEWFYELFMSILTVISLFFYRWDSYLLYLFGGVSNETSFNINSVNLTIILVFIFLMCFYILY